MKQNVNTALKVIFYGYTLQVLILGEQFRAASLKKKVYNEKKLRVKF